MIVYLSAAAKDWESGETVHGVRFCRNFFFFSWVCFYSVFSRRYIPIKCVDDKTLGRTVSVSVLAVIQQASPHAELSQE